jgi:translation initiation factor IF-2
VAVRIYSLAKDLGIDSKELVDLCARIGIQGKGSALASLENDEIAKIKNHLAEKSAPAPEVAKESPKPSREPVKDAPIRDLGRPGTAKREIGSIRRPPAVGEGVVGAVAQESEVLEVEISSGLDQEPSLEVDSRPESSTAPTDDQGDQESEGSDQEAADVESQGIRVGRVPAVAQELASEGAEAVESEESDSSNVAKGDSPAAMPAAARSRDSRVAEPSRDFTSMNVPGKVRVIGRTKPVDGAKPVGTGEGAKGVRKPREPVINLAKIPKSAAPTPVARAQEPATLKPLVKLTPEVLKGVQQQQKLDKQPGAQDKAGVGAAKTGTGAGRATAPSQTQHAGLTEFKQAAENKLNQKSRKPTTEVEEPARKKGLASLEASRAERSKLRLIAACHLACGVAFLSLQVAGAVLDLAPRGREQPGAKRLGARVGKPVLVSQKVAADGLNEIRGRLSGAQPWPHVGTHISPDAREVLVEQHLDGETVASGGTLGQFEGVVGHPAKNTTTPRHAGRAAGMCGQRRRQSAPTDQNPTRT